MHDDTFCRESGTSTQIASAELAIDEIRPASTAWQLAIRNDSITDRARENR